MRKRGNKWKRRKIGGKEEGRGTQEEEKQTKKKKKMKRKDGENKGGRRKWGENEGSERALLKEEISGGRGGEGVKQKRRKV